MECWRICSTSSRSSDHDFTHFTSPSAATSATVSPSGYRAGMPSLPGSKLCGNRPSMSPALGEYDQPDFLNQVIEVETLLHPIPLLQSPKRNRSRDVPGNDLFAMAPGLLTWTSYSMGRKSMRVNGCKSPTPAFRSARSSLVPAERPRTGFHPSHSQ